MAEKQPPVELLYTNWFSNVPRLEARSIQADDGKPRLVIGGYGCVFGAMSDPRLGFREVVERSCFNKSQGDGYPLVRALFEHQPGIVLGAVHSGTMRINQDSFGMAYEVDMPETRSAEYESIKRGDVHSSSIAFNTYQDDWRLGDGGMPVRHLVSARLDHIAPTSMPAYPDATVSLRSLAVAKEAELDDVIRDALANDLGRYFIRTDNIDKRDPMTEQRSAPLVAINMTREGIEIRQPEPEPKSEEKPEEKPEVVAEEGKPEPKPEPVVEAKPEPKAEKPAPEQKPVEVAKSAEPEVDPARAVAELELRMRRNRLYGTRPDDPIV